MESRDLLGRGEALIARDPSGALFATLQTNGKDPEDFQAEAGDWIWQQLYSHQPTKATAFYQTLFNYNTFEHTLQNKEGVEHYILASQSHARGAIRAMPEAFSQTAKSQWVPFVQVESVAQTLDIAIENGATIVMAPDSDVLDGQLAVLSDPNGAVIGVMTWEYTPQEAK
nr:VOC family protein [Echinimonas agarilytica]